MTVDARTVDAQAAASAWRRRGKIRQSMLRTMCRGLLSGPKPVRVLSCRWSLAVARDVAHEARDVGLVRLFERQDGLWMVLTGEGRTVGKIPVVDRRARHRERHRVTP